MITYYVCSSGTPVAINFRHLKGDLNSRYLLLKVQAKIKDGIPFIVSVHF